MNSFRAAVLCLILLVAAPCAFATDHWIGTTGNWTDLTNWDAYDWSPLVIDNGGTAIIHVNSRLYLLSLTVGDGATGNVRQDEGTVDATFGNPLILGNQAGSSGTYILSGTGGMLCTSLILGNQAGSSGTCAISDTGYTGYTSLIVGNNGTGTFTQSGGTVQGSSDYSSWSLYLGKEAGSSGIYELTAGSLTGVNSSSGYIGYNGSGTITQKGGTVNLGSLSLGYGANSWGRYELSGTGTVKAAITINHGEIVQTGGTITGPITINQGSLTQSDGSINILSGTFTINSGQVTQSGGTVNSTGITLGSTNGTGNYLLSGGTVTLAGTFSTPGLSVNKGTFTMTGGTINCSPSSSQISELVNDSFTQSGGTNNFGYPLVVTGTYSLGGNGALIGGYGTCLSNTPGKGVMVQTGGQACFETILSSGKVYGYFAVGGNGSSYQSLPWYKGGFAYGEYQMSGGSLQTAELILGGFSSSPTPNYLTVLNNAASISVGELMVMPSGGIKAVPGTKILIDSYMSSGGYYLNGNSHADQVADLVNVALDYEVTVASPGTLYVSGTDLGAVDAGFAANFAIGSVIVGENVPTTTQLSNSGFYGLGVHNNVQYVEDLVIGTGSTLDLKGCKLYYYNLTNLGTILLDGGSLVQVFRRGDFNQDGHVDDADYTVWADYFCRTPPSGYQTGDDPSGGYDDGDYTNWADHFNGFSGNSTVPEPATLALLLAGALSLRRRRA